MHRKEESLVTVGKILSVWGLKGELIVMPLTFDQDRLLKLHEVSIESQGVTEKKRIISVRPHKNNLLIGFEGCENPEDARKYRGALIKIEESESPRLPDGIYYHYQIIGLDVYTDKGEYLGQVRSILQTGSNDVYIVRGKDREYLIPAIKDFIKEIDLKTSKMIVRPMEVIE